MALISMGLFHSDVPTQLDVGPSHMGKSTRDQVSATLSAAVCCTNNDSFIVNKRHNRVVLKSKCNGNFESATSYNMPMMVFFHDI